MSGNGDESQVTAPGRKRGSRRKGKAAVEAVGVETEASAGPKAKKSRRGGAKRGKREGHATKHEA